MKRFSANRGSHSQCSSDRGLFSFQLDRRQSSGRLTSRFRAGFNYSACRAFVIKGTHGQNCTDRIRYRRPNAVRPYTAPESRAPNS